MSDKWLKAKSNGNGQAATDFGPKPGDFPLGSVESRAAARAVISGSGQVDPYDQDCMLIYCCESLVNHSVMFAAELRSTNLFKRGWELMQAKCPIVPAHLDPHTQRCTQASLAFEGVHRQDHRRDGGSRRREPSPGDTLTYNEVAARKKLDEVLLDQKREAWERHFPTWPFPIRIEDGRLYQRLARPVPRQDEWQEDVSVKPRFRWASIEQEALGLRDNPKPACYRNGMPYYPPDHNDPLIISAVVFVQPRNVKHCVEPLTWTDEATWPAEVAQIVGEWKRKLDNPSEQRPVEMRI